MFKIIIITALSFVVLTLSFVSLAQDQSQTLNRLDRDFTRHQWVIDQTMTDGSCQSVNACTPTAGVGEAVTDCRPNCLIKLQGINPFNRLRGYKTIQS